jgi:acyl-CoA synthetase (NDP forming)
VHVTNPLDYHTYIWGDAAASTEAFSGLMDCAFDAHVLVLDFPRADRCDGSSWHTTLDAFVAAKDAARAGTAACVVSTLPEGMPDDVAAKLLAHGLAPMQGTSECLAAIGHAAAFAQAQRLRDTNTALHGPAELPAVLDHTRQETHATPTAIAPHLLNEVRSKALLAQWGVPLPRGAVGNAAQAPALAQRIGFPVVVKAVSDTLAHKTDVGGVQLNLRSTQAVAEAVANMEHVADEFLVESMELGAVAEIIVGIQRDPQFGLALTLGAGGVWVELLKDSATLLFPVRRSDVHACLLSLRMRPLLEGYRDQPAGDIEALVEAVMAIAAFGEAHAATLQELEVNPLLVFPQGRGVRAVDALILTTDRSIT